MHCNKVLFNSSIKAFTRVPFETQVCKMVKSGAISRVPDVSGGGGVIHIIALKQPTFLADYRAWVWGQAASLHRQRPDSLASRYGERLTTQSSRKMMKR